MTDVPTDPAHDVELDATPPVDGTPVTADGDARPVRADLDRIERELAGVEAALRRLDDGTYWTDEVTGEPIPDDVLAADPVARRGG